MIAKKYRIERTLIDYILKKGESLTSRLFIVRYKKNDKSFNRYRTVISKKIENKATKRNLIRRRIYEAITVTEAAKNIKKIENTENKDIILIPKKQIVNTEYREIEKDIREFITKLWTTLKK
jgi:ribonuclease P protein component